MPIQVRINIEAAVYESPLSARGLFAVLSVPIPHLILHNIGAGTVKSPENCVK